MANKYEGKSYVLNLLRWRNSIKSTCMTAVPWHGFLPKKILLRVNHTYI